MNDGTHSNVSAAKARIIDHMCAECVRHPEHIAHDLGRISFERRAAGRPDDRLSIRNDLGTTDMHVVAIHVSSLSATLTYTDTHRSRAAFLRKLLEPYRIIRKTKPVAPSAPYDLRAGVYTSDVHEDLEQYVTLFGSRLVFRIDRESARKQLEHFVRCADAMVLLRWAAADNAGYCAVLQEGEVQLICTAVTHARSAHMRLGMRLDELLSSDATRTFLLRALGIVTTGLLNHQSLRVINEDIESELIRYLESTDQAVLTAAFDHAMLVSARLDRIQAALVRLRGEPTDNPTEPAHLARNWEKHASDIAARSSRLLEATQNHHRLHPLLTEAGTVAEALAQAAFKLTFMPREAGAKEVAPLTTLADLVNQSASEYVRCLEVARDLRRTAAPARADLEHFLLTIDRLADLDRQSDATARSIEQTLVSDVAKAPQPAVLLDVVTALRYANESLARCSVIARDYVFAATAGDK